MEKLSEQQEAVGAQEVISSVYGLMARRGSYVGSDGSRKMKVRDQKTGRDITVNFMGEQGQSHAGDQPWVMNVLGYIFLDETREGNLVVTDHVETNMADLTDDTTSSVDYGQQELTELLSRLESWQLDHPANLAA